jgi:hypothetical protein
MVSAATPAVGKVKATYLVVYAQAASGAEARAAVKRLGGTILREDRSLGYAKVTTTNANFLKGVRESTALDSAARNRIIATLTPGQRPKDYDLERPSTRTATVRTSPARSPRPGTGSGWPASRRTSRS